MLICKNLCFIIICKNLYWLWVAFLPYKCREIYERYVDNVNKR